MNATTQQGDAELNDVDSIAARLQERFEKHDEPASEAEETTDDVDEVEEIEATEEATEEVETDQEVSDEDDADAGDEEYQFQSVTELAEALDMPVDDFLSNIKITAKVNGGESEVSLSELQKGYQLTSDYQRKNQAFVEEQKAFNEQKEKAQSQIEEHLQRAGTAFQIAQNQLTSEFSTIDWNKLQAENPAEWSVKRAQFGERQALLNQQINKATQDAQAFRDQQKAEQAQERESRVQEEQKRLLDAIPDWKDEKVSSKEYPEVLSYLSNLGYSADEIDGIIDHRVYVMARDAMTAKQVKSDVNLAKNKIKKAPKLVKPNARQNVNQGKANKVAQLKKRFKKSGSTDDLAAMLLAKRS